jgi:rare lipoprotein A
MKSNSHRLIRTLLPILLTASLSACISSGSGGYYMDDGPHSSVPVNPHTVKDAVPKREPLSRGGNKPYSVFGKRYTPMKSAAGYRERGIASWYGKKFHGRRTSNGESYNMYAMSAAHKTLPLPSYVRVTNLKNGRSVIARVNDRGPFLHNRIIDLSYTAATRLGIVATGTGLVEVKAVNVDNYQPDPTPVTQLASAAKTSGNNRIYLQLGAFSDVNNAYRLQARLESAISNVIIVKGSANGRSVHRVRVGPLNDVSAVDRIASRIRSLGIYNSHVVIE